jgi:tetratricopeptide (TPR) repeat protein/serine/threonine protein kinase
MDPGTTADLGDSGCVSTPSPPHAGATGLTEGPGTRVGPYTLLQQIGAGGMGTVWVAEQTEPMRRLVALKVIKAGMDSAQVIARFEAERQALALMDHPHIARVFDGGTTVSGRPFFVMELVKGTPITQYCDEHQLNPRERLELFILVCQAIQHAHQKGVIHRDVKPSNVLVAPCDGKPVVKVIDFGVAKAAGQRLTERTLVTVFGAVIGTLEYMSPEQAELTNQDIDTRSDVYSLGVLLYELLTGSTPLTKARLKQTPFPELLRLIREEEAPKPSTRLRTAAAPTVAANRGVDPKRLSALVRGDLDWIVMKALEKDRDRRYESASAFAADVQRYLQDEPVQACPPSAWYRFRKFARRHKAGLWTTLAVSLVLLLAGSGIGWVLWERSVRRAETDLTVSEKLGKAEYLANQVGERKVTTSAEAEAAVGAWQEADAALAAADAALRTGAGDERLRQRVRAVRQQIEQGRRQAARKEKLLRGLDEARMRRFALVKGNYDYAGSWAKYADAFAAYELALEPGRTEEFARRIRDEEPAIRDALIVALDDWAFTRAGKEGPALSEQDLRAIAAAADGDPWRRAYRAAVLGGDRARLREVSGEARRVPPPPATLLVLAKRLLHRRERDEALALLRWGRDRYPTDIWLHLELGAALEGGKGASAVQIEEAMGCYHAAMALRPNASVVHNNLGKALCHQKRWDEAIAAFRQAIALDPTFALAYCNLGKALKDTNQLDDAIAACRKAIALDPRQELAHFNLGTALAAKRQFDEAIAAYRRAIELDPGDAQAHNNLGAALKDTKQSDEAIAEFRKAIALDPESVEAHYNLGSVLYANKQLDDAIAAYRQAIALDPTLSLAHMQLGVALMDKHQSDEAIAALRRAIELDPGDARAHNNLGRALTARNQLDEAIAVFRKAIDLDPRYAPPHDGLGTALALRSKDQLDQAIAEHRKAINLDPKFAGAYYNLGNALKAKNQLDEAIAAYRRAIELDPGDAQAHCNLGNVLKAKGQLDEAIAAYRRAIELDPKDWLAHNNLGSALKAKGQLDEAIREYTRVVELAPKFAEGHGTLGRLFRMRGHFAEARDATRRCLELLPPDHALRQAAIRQLQQCEQCLALESKLAATLEGKEKPTDADELLALAGLCQEPFKKLYVTSARFYAEALAAEPKLADDLRLQHRYNAACVAALAGSGQGEDGARLGNRERARWRRQAVDWLRADLTAWTERLENGNPADRDDVQQHLRHWQKDTDLAGIRDPSSLARLPEAERETCRKLWSDVDVLLARVKPKAKEAPPDKP